MPRKKKSFIDKKTASTFHLVRRSQRDVGLNDVDGATNETLSEFVLMPSPNNKKKFSQPIELEAKDARRPAPRNTAMETFEDEKSDGGNNSMMKILGDKLSKARLTEDSYDYSQHLLPIDGSGSFFNATNGKRYDPARDPRSKHVPLQEESLFDEEAQRKLGLTNTYTNNSASELNNLGSLIGGGIEVDRNLESIALTPDCMDEDMAQALFGNIEEGDFEEILDDFVVTAAQEIDDDELPSNPAAFNYDEHIRQLIAKAKAEESNHGHIDEKDNFFANAKPLRLRYENDEEYDSFDEEFGPNTGVAPALNPDEEKALCEKFEQTLGEYDSDEVGDLDNECEEIMGNRPLEGDVQLEAAFDEFLTEKRDNVFMEGTRNNPEKQRRGGSSYSALVGKTMIPASKLTAFEDQLNNDQPESKIPPMIAISQELKEADRILANPEMEPPEEDVLIDGKSYFSQPTVNPWDCESILSTYSNLDNNPCTIRKSSRSRRGKKKEGKKIIEPLEEEDDYPEEYHQIQLSNKTGLPMNTLPVTEKEESDCDYKAINRGKARKKGESAEEKRRRKQAIKEERLVSRIQKKMVKEAFKDEFLKRASNGIDNDVRGKSVFKFS